MRGDPIALLVLVSIYQSEGQQELFTNHIEVVYHRDILEGRLISWMVKIINQSRKLTA